MPKNNHSSLRYSDEVAEIINGFEGNSFNEKFENLVFHCYNAIPEIDAEISNKKTTMKKMDQDKQKLFKQISELKGKVVALKQITDTANTIIKDLDRLQVQCKKIADNKS
jgi:chromosome segregation ATPase